MILIRPILKATMKQTPRTPLDSWIKAKIGLHPDTNLNRRALGRFQLAKLRQTIAYARERSSFYQKLFESLPTDPLGSLEDMSRLPFTTADDLRRDHLQMLCVSQDRVARVITLLTSGTTAQPKRLYFTDADLELTTDFFQHGMSTLVEPGQRVLILMPGPNSGSIADLLQRGLARMQVAGLLHGVVSDPPAAIEAIVSQKADCLVGLPVQVLGLARHPEAKRIPTGQIKSVLLSADYVPQTVVREISAVWGASVYEHYGMTEMGYGGGVQCAAKAGYHLREADLYFEMVDPDSGQPLAPGQMGEVVFTTLTRQALPLIRYRTGDLSRFIEEPCPCGTALTRLDKIRGRLAGRVRLGNDQLLTMADLDETLLALPGILNYQAAIYRQEGKEHLTITVYSLDEETEALAQADAALTRIPAVAAALAGQTLIIDPIEKGFIAGPRNTMIKRSLNDHRKEDRFP
jgi:phenylacetate-CoA ligase